MILSILSLQIIIHLAILHAPYDQDIFPRGVSTLAGYIDDDGSSSGGEEEPHCKKCLSLDDKNIEDIFIRGK